VSWIARASIVFVIACGSPLPAPGPEPFTSPGPLSASHAAIEARGACDACHVGETGALDGKKCLGCHDHQPLAVRVANGRGLHASELVAGKPCRNCHLEHRGRDHDVTGWNSLAGGRDRFDHDLAGWPLRGAHRASPCERCHTTTGDHGRRTYVVAETTCASCHAQELHRFTSKEVACERCHTDHAWMPVKPSLDFDHDDPADARMRLGKAHASIACATCHPRGGFGLGLVVPERCDTCHVTPHAGHLFQRECTQCHTITVRTFDDLRAFDHSLRTRFELGGHRVMACVTCHPPSFGARKPTGACERCHADDSRHGDRFEKFGSPPRCDTCHGVHPIATPSARWRPNRFDHRATRFPLDRAHADLACRDCHRGSAPDDFERFAKPKSCKGCHAHAKVHADAQHPKGRFTDRECLMCHFR
jgi:hypothetical protein